MEDLLTVFLAAQQQPASACGLQIKSWRRISFCVSQRIPSECLCERTDGFERRRQRVRVSFTPSHREDVHGVHVHDALGQRLGNACRQADGRFSPSARDSAGVYRRARTHKHLYLQVAATAGVLWPEWSEPHTPLPAAEGSPPPATCPWQSLCCAMSVHTNNQTHKHTQNEKDTKVRWTLSHRKLVWSELLSDSKNSSVI